MMALPGTAPQRGIAALEMLLVLPLLLLILAALLFFGRYFTYYTAAQKAAQDASRYLATVSLREMKTPGANGGLAAVTQIAQAIAVQETAGLQPSPYGINVTIVCQPLACSGLAVPVKVTTQIQMQVTDQSFTPFSDLFLGNGGLFLSTQVTMLYVGQ